MDKIFTAEEIRKLISSRGPNYASNIKIASKLKVHSEGSIPDALINVRRPSESEEVKKYRNDIYVPKTQNPIQKVFNSLEKIRRSTDWNIQYKNTETPPSVTEKEKLEEYCEKKYPGYESVTNWAFAELLRRYLVDSNSWVAIIPTNIAETTANSAVYLKPLAVVFDSSQVLNFSDDYVVLLSSDKSTYTSPQGRVTRTDGNIYYILTDSHCYKFEQSSSTGDLTMTMEYRHGFGILPAFKTGGVYKERKNNETIFDSRISSMVPSLDEAAREYSDLQAEIVQHIHSEKYIYTNNECTHCRGVGAIIDVSKDDGSTIECPTCKGAKVITSVNPYGVHLIQMGTTFEQQMPTPPIGYVQKNAEIAKLQDERVKQHLFDALSTLNMEFLAETPMAQSGVAKAYDKDELNNFVNSIAEDIVRIMDRVYYFIARYRYSVVASEEAIQKMLPQINVPTKYDLLSSDTLLKEIETAKTSKVNPVIIRAMEIDYAKKKFNTEPEVAYELAAVFLLDPLYGLTNEEKSIILANSGITEIDYVLSCNIQAFVQKAIMENEAFIGLDSIKQRDILNKYAEEKFKTITETKKAKMQKLILDFNAGN